MPKNKDFYLRVEILDSCLRNQYGNWTLAKLVTKINEELYDRYGKTTSRRTIQGDLQYLIKEKDAPVERVKVGIDTCFFYSDPNFSIKNLPIKREEIAFVKEAIDILRQVNNFKVLKDVDQVISKLQSSVNLNSELSVAVVHFEDHTVANGTDYIDDLYIAVKEKCAVKIFYQPFSSENPKEFIFHAYLLKEYRNRWFVLGRIGNNLFPTTFALDRIKKIANTREHYIGNDIFEPTSYFNNLIGVSIPESRKIETLEIRVKRGQAPYLKTKPLHFTQEIVRVYKNGDLLIRVNLMINFELKAVLLSYGCEIEVVRPLTLRSMLKKELEDAVLNYE